MHGVKVLCVWIAHIKEYEPQWISPAAVVTRHFTCGGIVRAEGPLFIKQELAHFSNDQRFVHNEHVVVGVMQFDNSRVFHT